MFRYKKSNPLELAWKMLTAMSNFVDELGLAIQLLKIVMETKISHDRLQELLTRPYVSKLFSTPIAELEANKDGTLSALQWKWSKAFMCKGSARQGNNELHLRRFIDAQSKENYGVVLLIKGISNRVALGVIREYGAVSEEQAKDHFAELCKVLGYEQ